MNPITAKQQAVLDYITSYWLSHGYGPTVREIGEEFGIGSPNGIMCHLKALDAKGFISWNRKHSRTLVPANWREFIKEEYRDA